MPPCWQQCCNSRTFWWRLLNDVLSSVADPWYFDTDPNPGIQPLTNGSGSNCGSGTVDNFSAVLRILTFLYGSGSCYFRQWPSRLEKNSKFSCLLPYCLKVPLYNFSKIKSRKEVTKQLESMFFLLSLLDDRRIRTPYLWLIYPNPGRPKKYGSYGSGSATLVLHF